MEQISLIARIIFKDEETKSVMIGEIGGSAEEEAAEFLKREKQKPWLVLLLDLPLHRVGEWVTGAIISEAKEELKIKLKL